jgi:hypothetical protein
MTLAPELCIPRWKARALWRLSERDSGHPEGDVKGSPSSFPYGKVTGLDPDLRVITEVGESPYVCCGYCATHMACWTAEEGLSESMFEEAHEIRSAAGRSHNSGSNATELRNGASEALGIDLEAIATSEIRDQLEAGYAVSASLQYADLPDYLKVQGGDFGHGVCLYGYKAADDLVGYFDPLWPQGAQGAWTRWQDLTPSLWSDGNHSTTTTKWAVTPPPPVAEDVMFNIAPATTHRLAIVRNCADLYGDSAFSSKVDTGSEGQPLGFVGSTNEAHLVAKGDNVLYVRRADVLEIIAGDLEHE